MNTRRELDKLFAEATKGKNKEVAFELGCCVNTVDRETNGKAKYQLLEKLQAFMNAEDGDRIVRKVCELQGGFFFRDISRDHENDFKIVPALLKEFSELMSVLADSLLDGKVTDKEYTRMRKEWADCQSIVHALFVAIEKGDYSER